RDGGSLSGKLHAPLRPDVPTLEPGASYLLDAVIRTVKLGHLFTQGTVDSNEVWLEVTVTSGDRVIGASGKFDDEREVDPWSHFVNVFLLDVNGKRIDRRNPQDIFTPLYNHQIPPGAGQVVHYQLELPSRLDGPITVEVKLNYRKFDKQYTDFIARSHKTGDLDIRGLDGNTGQLTNQLPVTVLAVDRVTFPVAGDDTDVTNDPSSVPTWMRWNDYGIGLFLKGKSELRQAGNAFGEVEKLGRFDGPLNLARVLFREGRLGEAAEALARASGHDNPSPPAWTIAWLSGLVARDLNQLEKAEKNFRSVIDDRTPEMVKRGFDFSKDYRVINLLGQTYFDRARRLRTDDVAAQRNVFLQKAAETFHRALVIDSENVTAHYNLQQLYRELGDNQKAEHHAGLHARFKPDDNARDRAVGAAKARYPAANAAAEEPVFYRLQRPGAPGLPAATTRRGPRPTTQSGADE
ncbi:MAG: tetratricopeptide repeat protein, partial [Planctomycetota bacterium]|nr:tetratricopeptide repeat protein [Planctomycetota bacterium]